MKTTLCLLNRVEKLCTILFTLLLFTKPAASQNLNLEWVYAMGDTACDFFQPNQGQFLLAAPGNDYYMLGNFCKRVDFDCGPDTLDLQSNGGYSSNFIARYNNQNQLKWVTQISSIQTSLGKPKTDPDGNLYLSIFYDSYVTLDTSIVNPALSINGSGSSNSLVVKLDSNGDLAWYKNFVGANKITITGLDVDVDGNSYLYGMFEDSVDADPGPGIHMIYDSPVNLNGDIFIIKLDPAGDFIWTKSISGKRIEFPLNSLIDNVNHQLYIVGIFKDTVDFDPGIGQAIIAQQGYNPDPQVLPNEVFILKLDTAGNFIWVRQAGPVHSSTNVQICFDLNLDIYVSFDYTNETILDPLQASLHTGGNHDGFIISKWTKSGVVQWAKSMRVNSPLNWEEFALKGMQIDPQNNLIFTGFFRDTIQYNPDDSLQEFTTIDHNYDFFLGSISNSGSLNWAVQTGSYGQQKAHDVWIDNSNHIYLTGTHSDTCDYDPGPGNTFLYREKNYSGIFVEKFNQNPLVIDETKYDSGFMIYPNPCSEFLNFNSMHEGDCVIRNAMGQTVLQIKMKKGKNRLDVHSLAPGIYSMLLHSEMHVKSRKFAKQ